MKIIFIFLFSLCSFLFAKEDYGNWNSPISAETVTRGPSNAENMFIDGASTYWVENGTIFKLGIEGKIKAVTPPNFQVNTSVHEYGGGAFAVSNDVIYASNAYDQAIYIIKPNALPKKLTDGKIRFADLRITSYGLIAIGEEHEEGGNVKNFLGLIDENTGKCKKLANGKDFYSSPSISRDEKKIAWISWNHPNMPWTNTELWMGELTKEGEIKNIMRIGDESVLESFFEPQWSSENILYFVSDRDRGWWNLHRYINGRIENVCPMQAEVAEPLWSFGLSTYAFLGNKIVFTYNKAGKWHLGILNPKTKKWTKIEQEGTYLHQLRQGDDYVEFLEQYMDKGEALVRIDAKQELTTKVLLSQSTPLDKGYISTPIHISYPSNGHTAYGFYYPPQNKDYQIFSDQKPPLIVMIHGGPTSQAKNSFQLQMQFWTSRGFAILDVNYGGSTGYGRHYRNLLDHKWGVVDVEDSLNGALYLVKEGLVDQNKLVIRGGSSGGFTTLSALTSYNIFKAGASYYGVADITSLARDTHKFEKRYIEQLIGKYPEDKHMWKKRSPLYSVNSISSPLILFQGEADPIVPKNQSIMIYEALKNRGVNVELYIYPGEGHGFRQQKNFIASLEREINFYLEAFDQNPV